MDHNREYPYDGDPDPDTYIQPADRPTEWARMAAADAALGRSLTDIATSLCVSEDTAANLIRLHQTGRVA
jgi:hypothetical protein